MSPEITELLIKIRSFRDNRDWAQFHTLKNLSAALSVEAAELLEISQWTDASDLEKKLGDTDLLNSFSGEIADVFIYLLLVCEKLNIDPVLAAEKKIAENEIRYPVGKSRGTAKKYSKL